MPASTTVPSSMTLRGADSPATAPGTSSGVAPRTEPYVAPVARARMPSLDGLRAIAILLVLTGHVWGGHVANSRLSQFVNNIGGHGVTVFFVISGYLITHLLLRELARTGTIAIGRFYLRRALRLWPALWLTVGVTLALSAAGVVHLRHLDAAAALLFFENYTTGASLGPLRHTWSLSLEEQFYLVWPLVLLMAGQRRARWVLPAAVIAAPVVRMVLFAVVPGGHDLMNFALYTRYDSLGAGCLLALWEDAPGVQAALERIERRGGSAVAVTAFTTAFVAGAWAGWEVNYPVGYSVEGLAVAYLIAQAVRCPGRGAFAVLNWRPLAALGVISYGLYLWQQLFVVTFEGPFSHDVLALAAALAAASASYWAVERPLARLRRRLTVEGRGLT